MLSRIGIPGLSALLLATSCATDCRRFAVESAAFQVLEGRIQRVDGLITGERRNLADGVAARVAAPGCKVSLEVKGEVRVLDLKRGSIVVFGGDGADFVLEPLEKPPPQLRATRALAAFEGRPLPAHGDPSAVKDLSRAEKGRLAYREARALIARGRFSQAREALERAHALAPEVPEITDSLVHHLKQVGLDLYGEGDSARALELWQRVLQLRPEDTETRSFIRRATAVLNEG